MVDVLDCLEAREDITVDRIAIYISSLQKTCFLNDPFYSQTQEQLRKATTKGEVLRVLESHVSWFNHSFLGKILKKFKVAIENYNNYVENYFNPFIKKSLFEIPRKSSDSFSGSGQFVLKLNVPSFNETSLSFVPQNVSANVVILLKDKLASVLGLSEDAIEFCSYDKGCFELVFGGPKAILKEMLFNNKRLMFLLSNITKIIPGAKVQALLFEDNNQLFQPLEIKSQMDPLMLTAKMTDIDQMFGSLILELTKSIESSNILPDVLSFVNQLVAHRSTRPTAKILPLFTTIDFQLDIRSFMISMNNYWSFFNCSLLIKLIYKYGSQDAVYELQNFLIKLNELSISDIPMILHHLPHVDGYFPDPLKVKMKADFFISDDLSVKDLVLIQDKIANVLRVEKYGLLLRRIDRKEHTLEYLVAKTNRDDLLKLTSLEMQSLNQFILELQFQTFLISLNTQCVVSNEYDQSDYDYGIETENESGIGTAASETESSLSLASSSNSTIADQQPIDLHYVLSNYNPNNDDIAYEDTKGVLKICGPCLEKENNEKLLIKRCLLPTVHGEIDAITAAWDSNEMKLVPINPRPHLPNGKEYFKLCDPWQHYKRKECNYAHNEIELEAWNYDLRKERQEEHLEQPSMGFLNPKSDFDAIGKSKQICQTYKERNEWKVNFTSRLKKTVIQVLQSELTHANYRDKFYYLLCSEESMHIDILSEKCDGQYEIQCCEKLQDPPQYMCRVSGMSENQVQYAVQASESVYFAEFKNGETIDLCKGTIPSHNFTNLSEYFYVSMSQKDFRRIQSSSCVRRLGWYKVHLEFEVKHSYFDTLHQAIISLPDSMITKITTSPDKIATSKISIHPDHITLHPHPHADLSLNEDEQLLALEAILRNPADCPVVISGPLGSGKTRILARTAYELAMNGLSLSTQQTRILMCAHHTNTIDTFVMKYLEPAFSKQHNIKIVRITRKSNFNLKTNSHCIFNRTTAALRHDVANGFFINDPVVIIITTYMTSLQVSKIFNRFHFTHILLDEAAQVREPEAIAALSLGDANTKVVIAGDSKQVGPSVLVLGEEANKNGLGTSLLERLEQQYKCKTQIFQQISPYLKYLTKNYRCNPIIVTMLSEVIYRPQSITSALPTLLQPNHPAVKYCPCIFYWCSQQNMSLKEKKEQETEAVMKQAQFYFSKWPHDWKNISKKEVCIISPFRAQLNHIWSELKRTNLKEITFLPSYQIQGHEFQAIILSTLEPLEVNGTPSNPTKSLVNPKIFNTVISRSKSFVVTVGDPFVLLKAEQEFPEHCWAHYLRLCLKHNTIFFHQTHKQKNKELKQKLSDKLEISQRQQYLRSRSEGYSYAKPENIIVKPSRTC